MFFKVFKIIFPLFQSKQKQKKLGGLSSQAYHEMVEKYWLYKKATIL